jgi:hypothetical protein
MRMEVEFEEVIDFMIHHAIQLGIHIHHMYMPVTTYNVLYQYYLYYTTP